MALVVESCPWEFLGLVSLMCPPPQPLIPQHLWISGEQIWKGDLGACG